jgi:serine/threonine protein kinase
MSDSSNRLKDIFLMAMDLSSPAQRSVYLAEACATDLALRQRVEAMLAAADAPGSFLEKPAVALDLTTDASTSSPSGHPSVDDVADRRVGPYKLLERIGEGGMGVVYTAQQTEPLRRTVAIKIIRPGMDSAQVLTRFEAERQALALMDHPNIAKVLDAGSTPDGQPYFVMELVKGTPITQFCDERRLSPRERLELFVPVCQAIQHAHQKGVIHRDIKPSNVLVALYDDKPVPKVIDFGVAKATGLSLTEKTLQTSFGAIVGTPEYMSPEQATFNQLDIDTRSDVYALGVLLYELLTGSTPVDKTRFKAAAILEVLRVVREEEPPRPSVKLSTTQARASIAATRGVNPDQLAQLLRGDLDWIVMKALEKDRNRRYETAAGLARDVERYLKDDVIEARPPSAGYRLRKFVKRNRVPVLAASVVALALLGGLGGLAWGMVEARRQEAQVRDALHQEAEQRQLAANAAQAFAAQGRMPARRSPEARACGSCCSRNLSRPTDPTLAMLLAIEGAKRHPGLLANNTLLSALDECREERTLPSMPHTLAFSPDNRRLLTVDGDQIVRIWDVLTGRVLVTFPRVDHPNGVKVLPGHWPGQLRSHDRSLRPRRQVGADDHRIRLRGTLGCGDRQPACSAAEGYGELDAGGRSQSPQRPRVRLSRRVQSGRPVHLADRRQGSAVGHRRPQGAPGAGRTRAAGVLGLVQRGWQEDHHGLAGQDRPHLERGNRQAHPRPQGTRPGRHRLGRVLTQRQPGRDGGEQSGRRGPFGGRRHPRPVVGCGDG